MPDQRVYTILVVEDDPSILELLVQILEDEGYRALRSEGRADLWEHLRQEQPDLVLLDLILTDADGLDICRRLRDDPLLSDVPIVMLTARSSVDDRIAGLAAGADDYLVKPFHPRELAMRVATHLRRSERERNLNSLTHLPGSLRIERAIASLVAQQKPFALCYVDIDHFKGYNDRYGFAAGDHAIQLLAEILRDAVFAGADDVAMTGHIGGDDFLALIGADRVEQVCGRIVQDFTVELAQLYTPEDLVRGYTPGRDRRGEDVRSPLISVSIAVVPVSGHEPPDQLSVGALAQRAAELKAFLKRQPGSNFMVDRRRAAGR